MKGLGLSHGERDKYRNGLRKSHIVRHRVRILDRNEDVIGEITESSRMFILEGTVQVDSDAEITRQLQLRVLDPSGILYLDPNSPDRYALFADRFIAVDRQDWIESLSRWVSCPVFHGPVTRLDQDGTIIQIEASGKEILYLPPALHWKTRTFKKGTKIRNVIISLLQDKGEQRIDIPHFDRALREPITLLGMEPAWPLIKKLAASVNRQAFYDGAGVFRMRPFPKRSLYTFRHGDNGDLITVPTKSYDFSTLRNVIRVRGPRPDNHDPAETETPGYHDRRIVWTAKAGAGDAASSVNMARNGTPRILAEVIENYNLKKQSDAKKQANDALDRALDLDATSNFDALPVPFLEEKDVVRVIAETGSSTFRLDQFTIPLLASDTMSIGYLKRSRVNKRRRAS